MTYQITKLGHLGDGVTAEGIFAPFTLPGEEIDGEVVSGRIAAPKIVTPVPERIKPACRHFKRCGGCATQHAADPFLDGWKAGIVRSALDGQGLDGEIATVLTSPPESRRRAVFSARRTKAGAIVGFHAGASGEVIDLAECPVLRPAVFAARAPLAEMTRIGASRKAELRFTVTESTEGLDILAAGGHPAEDVRMALTEVVGRYPIARLVWDDTLIAQAAPPAQRFGRSDVVPPTGAFLQATLEGQAALTAFALNALEGAKRVVEFFAGCGTFTLPLLERSEVLALEGEADMLAALDQGWRQAGGLSKLTTQTRDLFRDPVLAAEMKGFDAALLDPPRAGAQAQISEIAASALRNVAYISCNPQSFARDAKTLVEAGFRMGPVTVIDQFRWTPHVELAARFTR